MTVQIFGTRFQLTLGDLRLSIGLSVERADAAGTTETCS